MNPLAKKLQIKSGDSIVVLNSQRDHSSLLLPLPKGTTVSKKAGTPCDIVLLFAKNTDELNQFGPRAWASLKDDGIFWIAIPKKSSGMQEDLTMHAGWDVVDSLDLEAVASISIDATWSAFRFKPKGIRGTTKAKQKAAGFDAFIDTAKRTVTPPNDLAARLAANRKAKDFFDTLSFTNRKEYVVWILSAKQEATRLKRLDAVIEKLQQGLKNPAEK
ncbi:MAG: YdeI/OmpD-associated family protein [Ignavibacteriales bacterium]|nr:YdeI/OmpD-associated family protein [Ignavibacteriales bacterium]